MQAMPTMDDMLPRDRVLTALAHRQPSRVPFSWGFGPTPEMAAQLDDYLAAQGASWQRLRRATDDLRSVGPAYLGPMPAGNSTSTGIWGIRLKTVHYAGGAYEEFTDFPLAGIEHPEQLARHPWPDPFAYDYAGAREQALAADPGRRRATKLVSGNPFEIYCWMTGLEEAMVNLVMNPAVVQAALDKITAFFETRLRLTLEVMGDLVDIVFFYDDLGSQTSLLMSPEMYRQILQPCHRRLIGCARRLAPHAHVMMHSDGAVFDILPDLIDAGVDVLEAVQIDAAGMDPVRLKTAYGDRLSFNGGISVQQVLPSLDEEGVAEECRRLVSILGDGGGYIAAPTHSVQVGTPVANVLAMLRSVLGDEDYEQAMDDARSPAEAVNMEMQS
jgi:uroporphyrinogen decarboxylase